MINWPKSVPDYQWPAHYYSTAMAPVRWAMSTVFHSCYVLGSLIRKLNVKLYGFQALPTLVIRTDGIGDALLFEPALESVARRVSPSEVHVWAPAGTCQLFAECPSITRRLTIPRGCRPGNLQYFMSFWWHAKIGFELGRWTFERAIYPVESPEPLGNWLFLSARASDRWINWGDLHNQFDWQQKRTHEAATLVIESRPGDAHESLRNEYLSDQWAEEPHLRKPRVSLGQRATEQAGRILFDWRREVHHLGGREIVGLVVGGTSRVNHYPAQQWAAALRRLWEEDRVVAALLGGPSDGAAMDEVEQHLHDVPRLRIRRPGHLLTTAALIHRLDGMLTVDTGLAHMSLAMRVPTVVLVGGGHPGRFFPWPNTRDQIVLNVDMPCKGCQNQCRLSEAECVTKIQPDDIVEAFRELRQRSMTPATIIVPPDAQTLPVKVAG